MGATGSSPQPQILSMEVSSQDDSEYRILVGGNVKYVIVEQGTFDGSTLSMPLNSLSILPYEKDWTIAQVYRDSATGKVETSLSQRQLAGVEGTWHSNFIDVLALSRVKQISGACFECIYTADAAEKPLAAMAKIARFEWEIPRMERETRAYQILEGSGIAPRFLGHIQEHGRVIGFMLEKAAGREAGIEDLEKCSFILEQLHKRGVLHGDVNRYNFIVDQYRVLLIDFEGSRTDADSSSMSMEMESLGDQLAEDTGRGAGFR